MPSPPPSSRLGTSFRSQLGSWTSSSPLAAAAIASDLEEASDSDSDTGSPTPTPSTFRPNALSASYRSATAVAVLPRPAIIPSDPSFRGRRMSRAEWAAVEDDERELLEDNNLLERRPSRKSVSRRPDERTALLDGPEDDGPEVDAKWDEAVVAGRIQTTWKREVAVLSRYSRSLIVTFVLQYSLTMASIFTVGHIGKVELGAVSLATMTANITGFSVYQGLATSLDTLCAQAYGSGRKSLVGLQLQRMVYFLWLVTIPIGAIWLSGTWILKAIVPETRTAELAGLYLKIILLGAPGYAAFESGKRFVQAQGKFEATLYVLLFCAPFNAFLNWFLVWHMELGFIGAPIAVAITDTLLPLCLLLYVYTQPDTRACWPGFTRRALHNWGPMIRLALPGLVMVLAEFLAFEILTLAASWLSSTHLAAQSVLSTLTALTFQIPFPMSIAASTRIANLIGATLGSAAKTAAGVALCAAVFVGLFNAVLLSALRNYVPRLFTEDEGVIALVAAVLPLCAAFQLFDALTANCNGILRGLGRQEVGGYVNLFAYYVIAMPLSFYTAFGAPQWGLYGLWAGPALALGIVAAIEGVFIYRLSWEGAVEDARKRNAEDHR